MRYLGVCVLLLGVAAIVFVASEGLGRTASDVVAEAPARETTVALERLVGWAAFLAVAALVTAASGISVLSGAGRRTRRHPGDRKGEALR